MPLIDAVDHPANVPGGLIVAEVAAFMLEHCSTFRAHVGVLTNITEDHLDRFGTMEHYAAIKGRIWDFQRADDVAIANADDDWTMRETRGIPSQLFTFDSRPGATVARGAFVSTDRKELVLRLTSAGVLALVLTVIRQSPETQTCPSSQSSFAEQGITLLLLAPWNLTRARCSLQKTLPLLRRRSSNPQNLLNFLKRA